jgi:hypothetical protein
MKKLTQKFIFLLLAALPIWISAQEKPFFKAPDGLSLVSTDLHIHTTFSDGSVWPNIRVEEALKEGLDLISITDHLEYQPHRKDLPNPDRNRSFHIAEDTAKKSKLTVIRGAEITRSMPPGHINAVFIQDANKLLFPDDPLAGIEEANRQKGFVFWNHPNWEAQRKDGTLLKRNFFTELKSLTSTPCQKKPSKLHWKMDSPCSEPLMSIN